MSENEKLITLGQLLQIKREQMGCNVSEAIRRSKITALNHYEKGMCYPSPDKLTHIIDFYKITNEELAACRPNQRNKTGPKVGSVRKKYIQDGNYVELIISHISSLLNKVDAMKDHGGLANNIKKESQMNLEEMLRLSEHILILDKIFD